MTIGPQSHSLPDPFVVMATMNPLDSRGDFMRCRSHRWIASS